MGQQSAPREPVLVSACLLGVACNHRGEGRPVAELDPLGRLREAHRLIPVCPEVAGGLPIPRPAAERGPDARVRTAAGEDVTDFYDRGARHAVSVALAAGARRAILKARSPSCGCREIYDGSHAGVLVAGEGVTAEALRRAGIEVVSEEDL